MTCFTVNYFDVCVIFVRVYTDKSESEDQETNAD